MKALVLGSLGVLTDTSHLWRSASRQAFRDHGIAFAGPRGTVRRARAADRRPVELGDVMRSRHDHFARALADGPLRARPGLPDLLDAARARGTGVVLVADAPTDWTVSVLDGLALDPGRFDAVVTRAYLTAPKPAPDAYHLAAALLAVAPEDCLAVEDAGPGVQAARAAGMAALDIRAADDPVAAIRAALGGAPVPAPPREAAPVP